ncbi:MAG: glycosyltransferase family 1 protein [Candidatus Cloacimonadales bacterium]
MKKYKILVSVLAYDNGKSGIADYINNVVKHLSLEHQLDILIFEKDSYIFPHKNPNIKFRIISDKYSKPALSMAYHLFVLPITLPLKDYDFVFLPAGNRRLFAHYSKKTLVTFHDLSQFHIANKYDAWRMIYIKRIIPFFLKRAQIIMAISESTKQDLVKFYGLAAAKIEVNYNGYEPSKLSIHLTKEQLQDKFNIEDRYILYISRIEHPGKNHLNLIKAYELLPNNIKKNYQLIFVGSEWSGTQEVMDYANKTADKDRILFLGFVQDQDLGALYKFSSLYAFPSFYEGFGIPLLEAMYSGTPVVCSNVSSLPEVGGDAVVTFDPHSPEDISAAIKSVLQSSELQNKMIATGFEQVKKFSWEKHCQKIIELVEKKN